MVGWGKMDMSYAKLDADWFRPVDASEKRGPVRKWLSLSNSLSKGYVRKATPGCRSPNAPLLCRLVLLAREDFFGG